MDMKSKTLLKVDKILKKSHCAIEYDMKKQPIFFKIIKFIEILNKIILVTLLTVILLTVSFILVSALSSENEKKLNDKIKSLENGVKELEDEINRLKSENTKLKSESKVNTENAKLKSEKPITQPAKRNIPKEMIKFALDYSRK